MDKSVDNLWANCEPFSRAQIARRLAFERLIGLPGMVALLRVEVTGVDDPAPAFRLGGPDPDAPVITFGGRP